MTIIEHKNQFYVEIVHNSFHMHHASDAIYSNNLNRRM